MKVILLILFFYLFFRFFFYIAAIVMGLILTALGVSAAKTAGEHRQGTEGNTGGKTKSSWFGDRFKQKPKVYKYPGKETFSEQDIADAEFEDVK